MSLPFEIQSEIIKRLPVKSLLRFRSLSKSCKSLIDSSDFIAHYSGQQNHLLVRCFDYSVNSELEHVSVVDDDTFPTHRVSVTLPEFVKYRNIIGSSHGLLCFYGRDGTGTTTGRVVILNPCIRKTVAFVVPRVTYDQLYHTVVGFGVCRETKDPKIVKVTLTKSDVDNESAYIPWQVEVFTLSTGTWRSLCSSKLPPKSTYIYWDPVVVDGCIYWLAFDKLNGRYNSVISFDLTSEEFGQVNLPYSLAHGYRILSTHKLRESLAVLETDLEASKMVYHVWMMEGDVSKSFNKLYSISSQSISSHSPGVSLLSPRGFRKTGEPLIKVSLGAQHGSATILAAYDPYSESLTNLGINDGSSSCFVHPYMETLLLL